MKPSAAVPFIRHRDGRAGAPAIWCLHGFGASGASFLEAFDAPELRSHPLDVPDFPGFGTSTEADPPQGIAAATALLVELVRTRSASDRVVFVAHSAGSLIAIRAAAVLSQVKCLISVEGNLTESDTFLSGRAARADDIEAWRRSVLEELRDRATTDEAMRRYCRDLERAAPATLRQWAISTVEETGTTLGGERFIAFPGPKLYAYGAKSIPRSTLDFLVRHDLPRIEFAASGHSPMVEEPERFYSEIATFIAHSV